MDHHQYYPWTYLLPDGRLFIAGPHDPPHRFTIEPIGGLETFPTIAGNRSTGGEKGTSVLLPLRPPDYAPRVLVLGGNTVPARNTAELIDLSEPMPAWQSLPNLNQERAEQVNSVLLPDGRVLVVGGANAVPGGGPVELLDSESPMAGFTLGPVMTYHRGYHSAAILLADGSVLVGGDPNSSVFERYRPGYFDQPRPVIDNAPANVAYGGTFGVDSADADDILTVHLLFPGAVTHGFNMTQRVVECSFSAGAGSLQVDAPPDGNVAPPGHYLLFIINDQRVPSEGRWITIG
ncbi:galactose oxidase-like domain-containing protein [Marinobacterium aestuariivivens]|uniref:Galactose oxidase-like domain-containing protein n=1 Tax=Marinobacterium aestuariivivens TaxID=1698799 RepID=A0ABW2A714_9GAMM